MAKCDYCNENEGEEMNKTEGYTLRNPKIGEAFCNADAVEGGAPAENLIVRLCELCGCVWAHDPNQAMLHCPSCMEEVEDII